MKPAIKSFDLLSMLSIGNYNKFGWENWTQEIGSMYKNVRMLAKLRQNSKLILDLNHYKFSILPFNAHVIIKEWLRLFTGAGNDNITN